jgi:hypothetical protein
MNGTAEVRTVQHDGGGNGGALLHLHLSSIDGEGY